jgi:hypothetical protein
MSAFIAALLVAISVPLEKDSYPDVSITATGQKNPKSNSSEVSVRLVSAPGPGVREFEGEGWEKRGDVFVSHQNQPKTLHYQGAWSSGAMLRIMRHPNFGIAEVSIGGKAQRLDLFAEKEDYVGVPLPEATVSWKGYLQRAALVVGLGLLFITAGMSLASAPIAWRCVFALALLAGCGTLWLVHDRSYAGSLEIVAFDASNELKLVHMDAGHGFTPALVVPAKGGTAVETKFALPNPVDWRLEIEGASLRVFRDLDDDAAGKAPSSDDNGCAIVATGRCVYEVQGAAPHRIWLKGGDEHKPITLPSAAAGSERLFLLVEREPGRITVLASRAYAQVPAWQYSRWIVALRLVGQDGKTAGKIVRLLSDGVSGYRLAKAVGGDGSYSVPTLVRPDTGSVVGMKIFAALVSASFVLLLASAGKIAMTLARSYCEGRRLQVLGSVLGCLGWLGLTIAIGWPGIMGWDGLSPYIQAQTGQVTLWYGIGYPMIVGGFLLIGPGALITIWSLLGTACLLLGAAALLLRRGSVVTGWLPPVLLCAVLPFTAIMVGTVTHLRDAMNGLMLAMFAFCGFYSALKWREWSCVQRNWILAALLLAGAMLALMRVDNIPTLLVLAAGLTVGARGFRLRSLSLVIVAAVCWLGVGPQIERLVVPDRQGAADEKRLYASTAVINPLVGVLAKGKGRIPDDLYAEISAALNKVTDVELAVQEWSPYEIVYWHKALAKRENPSVETIRQLRNLYVRSLSADPVLFMQLRLATFGAMLGHAWFELGTYPKTNSNGHPSFYDHLLTADPQWQLMTELLSYRPAAHPYPDLTRALLDWEEKVASTALQFIVCIVIALGFRRHPLAAAVAVGEIARAGVFLLFAPASVFLYIYDMHLLGFLLPMMALAEQAVRTRSLTLIRTNSESL